MSTRIDFARPWLTRLLADDTISLAVAPCAGGESGSSDGDGDL